MSEEKKVIDNHYKPFLVKAPCWIGGGKVVYDWVPASFARHPCDLFGKDVEDKDEKKEEWKTLPNSEKMVKKIIALLPEKIPKEIKSANKLDVSNFGRIGIPMNCKSKCSCPCKICHYILPQYEKCSWNKTKQEFENYNGWLVVKTGETEEDYVYRLVAEAFNKKEDGKQIHHIDNNGHHNTPDNLKPLTPEDHAKEHNQTRGCEMCDDGNKK